MKRKTLIIDGHSLNLDLVSYFIEENPVIKLSAESVKKIKTARRQIDDWVAADEIIYGVTTGFGEFANVKISNEDIAKLQENLIISHSVGVGENLPPVIVKIMMLLRINALAQGHSGISMETLNVLIQMLNNNIIPTIPSQGSVGSSGDLAPLSHLVLAMIGKGKVQVFDKNNFSENVKIKSSASVLKSFGIPKAKLKAKEGLALINGTQMMTSFASLICIRAKRLSMQADIAGAMSHEALRGTDKAYDARLHKLRPHRGQINTAANMMNLIKNSEIRHSHLENDQRVQDSYSVRCIPQIHGASKDAIEYVCSKVEIELNSVTDNPLIFPDKHDHIEGGNFHGQPMALALDFMKIALAELANVSERRTERLVNGSLSSLPRFLTKNGGLNSGLMIAQYTSAALVSENKTLAHPASVDSIPTSANQEDHNSMGSIAARHCFQILKNVESVIAIEMLAAAQGIEFLKPLECGIGTNTALKVIRQYVKPLNNDRVLHKDIDKMIELVRSGEILNSVLDKVKIK